MRMIKSILKFGGYMTLSLSLLVGCATQAQAPRAMDSQCVLACQASYTNTLAECRAFVTPISAQATKDEAEATCLRKLGYPRGAQSCAARCS